MSVEPQGNFETFKHDTHMVQMSRSHVESCLNYNLYLVNFVVKKTPKQPPAGPDADSEATSDGTKTSATEQGIIHLFFPKRIM